MTGLTTQVHDGCDESHIDTVEEVAMTVLILSVLIADATEIDLTNATLFEPSYSLLYLALVKAPEVGKVVHHTIRNDADSNLVAHFLLDLHQTVDRIIERRVTSDDDNGLIAIIDHHLDESFDTAHALALNLVIFDALLLQGPLYPFPATLWSVDDSTLRAIEYAPLI